MNIEHLPVMSREVIEILAPFEGGTYVDATVGLGGHSAMILEKIGQSGRVIGIDRDDSALAKTAERLCDAGLILKKGSFSDMELILHAQGLDNADGVLLDLGVSMMQFKDPGRGFSFLSNERLDMRMDSSQELSAWDVVNGYSEKELIRILREYGEEYRAMRIVRSIIHERDKKSIDTCSELAEIISRSIGRHGKVHPATKTFQALRIEVNRELEELKKGLNASLRILRKGGRLCVISYHSLEDRVVKHFIRENAKAGVLKQLMKKPLSPGIEEIRANPSSRSGKLRGAEKL
ncbi:MAG: 16S rRNA (cytosine(1402)-N(4))-methyltransferase [Nitrospira bacterium HGW-Nitrospira-1]|nr:MAG: 16S rRNA (cytosine(1402)-N(4))-methyltransferase [Nitrospira bacterium HGW-Nitrospira-1]